jgi:patatin-related protein
MRGKYSPILFVNKEAQTVKSNPAESEKRVPFDPEHEVRFAVVMYGGVSLAIYINGVAQELLNMVRATAPNAANGGEALLADVKLTGSLAVYRKLGQFLHQRSELAEAAESDAQGNPKPPSRNPIQTRFVVDVISGTSAGGINGIFLAKALARNQGMEGLKRLWLTEGDLGKLLNDKFSVVDLTGLKLKEPQASLLNSQRMYRKLLEALDQMDEQHNASAETTDSPLVSELDLFITTTDIEGIPLPITLSDSVVYERRYKNVFHFRYATKEATGSNRDDFVKANDPFLAFAARCTSSFPFAFEAMCLSDIRAVISGYRKYEGMQAMPPEWDSFFSEYLRLGLIDLDKQARGGKPTGGPSPDATEKLRERLREAFYTRAFGDGGYLDNKPFSHATTMLMRRRFEPAVDRKLLYVEPSPEHPELDPNTERKRPDFAQNIRAAVVDLPRKETIREDIEFLQERNAMLRRIAAFTKHVDEDMASIPPEDEKKAKLRDDLKHNFATADLRTMIDLYGVSYGAYHRLKVEEATALLADLIARAAGYDPASDPALAIREVVEAWRDKNYVAFKPTGEPSAKPRDTENAFLKKFDIRFVQRRLNFLRCRVAQLRRLDDEDGAAGHQAALDLLQAWLDHDPEAPALVPVNHAKDWDNNFRKDFCAELILIRKRLAPQATNVRSAQEKLLNCKSDKGKPAPLYEAISELDIGWKELQSILRCDGPKARLEKAKALLDEPGGKLEKALHKLAEVIHRGFCDSSVNADKGDAANNSAGAKAARACLDYFEKNFYYYDLVTYPVVYGTGAGEANEVDVFRVSPEDATALVDERGSGRSKLAGTALMSFGAFLDEGWRRNDMLWGRLDGAERIISALLPDESDATTRTNLIKQAHMAILDEEIKSGDIRTICDLVGSTLAGRAPLSEAQQTLVTFVQQKIKSQDLTEPLQAALFRCLDQPQKILEYYGSPGFRVNREFDAEIALRLISRATNVTGRMLEALAEDYRFGKANQVGMWIARLASIFWNIIGVAVPGSPRYLVLRYWLGLIYVFEFFLIFLGILFGKPEIKIFGWEALGLTLAFNLGVTMLGYYMSNKWLRLNVIRVLLAAGLVVLVAVGAVHVVDYVVNYFTKQKLSMPQESALVAVVALLLWIIVGWVEWRNWIGSWIRQLWSRLRRKPAAKSTGNDSTAPPPAQETQCRPAAPPGESPA